MTRVLVTGATSLLGGAVAQALAERGDEVTCLQRHSSGLGLTEVLADIRDAEAVRHAAQGHDAIVHLAALVAPNPRWADAVAINVGGTRHVLDAAQDCGRLLHVSSPSVAFADHASIGARAEAPTYAGRDAYAATKALAEQLVLVPSDVATVVLRPHLVWGPGDTQLVGRIVDRARQGRLVLPDHGRPLVATTFLDDAVSAIIAGLDRTGDDPDAWGRPLVVTGNDPRPLVELVGGILAAAGVSTTLRSIPAPLAGLAGRLIGRLWTGEEPPLTYFAARQLSVAHWYDLAETRRLLRWSPEVTVDVGLDRLADWYRSLAQD
ncbi:MAG: NAD-dependent epimerase/dehydratase family protein [Actinomycetes bacterium]